MKSAFNKPLTVSEPSKPAKEEPALEKQSSDLKKVKAETDTKADETAGFEQREGYNLAAAIIEHSVAKTWDEAKKEWVFDHMDEASDEEVASSEYTCICGHPHLKNLYYIRNINTDKPLLVGNQCVKKFLKNSESKKVITALQDRKLNQELIDYAYGHDVIDETECRFIDKVLRKRNLSSKQIAWKDDVTEKILVGVKRLMSERVADM